MLVPLLFWLIFPIPLHFLVNTSWHCWKFLHAAGINARTNFASNLENSVRFRWQTLYNYIAFPPRQLNLKINPNTFEKYPRNFPLNILFSVFLLRQWTKFLEYWSVTKFAWLVIRDLHNVGTIEYLGQSFLDLNIRIYSYIIFISYL